MRNSIVAVTVSLCCLGLGLSAAVAGDVCLFSNEDDGNVTFTLICGEDIFGEATHAVRGYSAFGTPCQVGTCAIGAERFEWTLSRSNTDPYDNTGPLTGPIDYLYLWLACDSFPVSPFEASAVRLRVETIGGDIQHVGTNMAELGLFNVGTATDLELALGCLTAPYLIAELVFFIETPVSIDAETWSSVKALYQ